MSIEDLSKTERTIYFYLVEQGRPLSVRDIARALSMPPSTVHYNLRKLESRKLVVKTIEGYIAKSVNPPSGFIYIGYKLVPRLLVYAGFFAGSTIGSLVLLLLEFSQERLVIFTVSALAFVLFFIEGLIARRALYKSDKSEDKQ
ncbi:MAG: winged helix-turn-helix domain-containing protein [Desulfurococcaceae archaeon]